VGIGAEARVAEQSYDMQRQMNDRNLAALSACRADVATAANTIARQNQILAAAQRGPNGAEIMELILGALKR
jgi:hypothetical protein